MASAQAVPSPSRLQAGARFNSGHSGFLDRPFDGDWSYGLAYEYHEQQAYFQLGLQYAPKASRQDTEYGPDIDAVWTPEFNLIFTDGTWRYGAGILNSQVRTSEGGEWTGVYWQFILGVTLGGRGSFAIDLTAFYAFDKWNHLDDFAFDDIDAGIGVSMAF
jgi:hypothetical protein